MGVPLEILISFINTKNPSLRNGHGLTIKGNGSRRTMTAVLSELQPNTAATVYPTYIECLFARCSKLLNYWSFLCCVTEIILLVYTYIHHHNIAPTHQRRERTYYKREHASTFKKMGRFGKPVDKNKRPEFY